MRERCPRALVYRAAVPLLAAASLLAGAAAEASGPARPAGAGELEIGLSKLQVLGSVLYVAAHPDDENTALIADLARGRKLRAAYLSVTRGDGGQNLIGSETGERMGVLRTQELLAARAVDGGEQFFTRAVDFGYSKTPEETLAIWGHEAVLADVVLVIRTFRPDVVITRFPTNGDGGHGHHTASAILAGEAFRAAGDPKRFPEQLARVSPWQPRRLYWNAWRRDGKEPPAGSLSIDVGAYEPLLGKSWSEIAAESRSMHKSQGFGSAERRGRLPQDLVLVAGDPAAKDPFDGIDTTWGRVPGSAAVAATLLQAAAELDPREPAKVLPLLLKAHAELAKLPGDSWVEVKRKELLETIRSATGLWLEAMAATYSASPGAEVKVTATAINRSGAALTLEKVELPYLAEPGKGELPLRDNEPVKVALASRLPADLPLSQPYWLRETPGKGLYTVTDPALVGRPEGPPPLVARFTVRAGAERLVFETPVFYRWTDPVKGEQIRPLEIAPAVSVHLPDRVALFADDAPRAVSVAVRATSAFTGSLSGDVRLRLPAGWKVEPPSRPFALDGVRETRADFTVTPPPQPGGGELRAEAVAGGTIFAHDLARIDYAHIPIQTLFPVASARALHVDLGRRGKRIGYVMGPGDEVPEVLGQMGYEVRLLSASDLLTGDLSRNDAIVTGVRAYNTRPELKEAQRRLLDWVAAGGTLVVQYNTNQELVTEELGPFPFKLSRDRVTVEEAPVKLLRPDSPVLAGPNRIGVADFEGWVQERGLYFPGTWDPRYETPLATNDPGEPEKAGALLYAKHGKGSYVYTGLAFFRQLPAGVPGAIRLFANLVSAGRTDG